MKMMWVWSAHRAGEIVVGGPYGGGWVRALCWRPGLGSGLRQWPCNCRTWLRPPWIPSKILPNFVKQIWCIKTLFRLDYISGYTWSYLGFRRTLYKLVAEMVLFFFSPRVKIISTLILVRNSHEGLLQWCVRYACVTTLIWASLGRYWLCTHDTQCRNKHWVLICCNKSFRAVLLLYEDCIVNSTAILEKVY